MPRDEDEPSILTASSDGGRIVAMSNNAPNHGGGVRGSVRLRTTLSVRPNLENNRQHGDSQQEFDAISEGSELMNESVVSSITDRYVCKLKIMLTVVGTSL